MLSKKFITTWFYAGLEKHTEDVGIFRTKIRETAIQRTVNYHEYAELLEAKYNELDAEGYDVVNVVPINMGQSEECYNRNDNYLGDVGFSITRGAVVVGKRRD